MSSSPETELQMGMGHPVIGRALAFGMRPSLSCDVISSNSGDMFSQMRLGLQFERAMRNDFHRRAARCPNSLDLTVRDALAWGTANGAHAVGMEDRIGSLTPGKQADVIVIGGRRLNLVPMADPVGCLVAQANAANVRARARGGALRQARRRARGVALDAAIDLAEAAAERVLGAATAGGGELLPPVPPSFADMINATAAANLARAWAIAPGTAPG